jgi:hypothetical protein
LRARGSWCGETHLQKAAFFLQELLRVQLGYEFVLYKHGPYSFDLHDELMALRADELLELRPQPAPYGPSLVPTAASAEFRERYPRTLGTYGPGIEFVSRALASKGVAELERLATALYLTLEAPETAAELRARRINELKPHVSVEEAQAAVTQVDGIIQQANALAEG